MGPVDDDELLQHLRVIHGEGPGHVGAPIVGDQHELLTLPGNLLRELPHVLDEMLHLVGLETLRLRRQVVPAHVEPDGQVVAAHFRHLILPLVPEGGIAVQEEHQRPLPDARVVQADAVHIREVMLERHRRALRPYFGRQPPPP